MAAGLIVLLATALLTVVPTDSAGAALPDAEARMLGAVNSARAANGLGSLSTHDQLTVSARNWAARMASDQEAGGDRRGALRHNPGMRDQLPSNYQSAGENVGYTALTDASHATLVDRLHDAYMASSGHRANILGDYNRVGIGLVQASDGTMWSTVVFMKEQPAPEPESEPEPEGESGGADGGDRSESASASTGSEDNGQTSESQPEATPQAQPEPEPEPEPEPVLEPPTTLELFGDGWPEGYLAGEPDAARGLLNGFSDYRSAAAILPGSARGSGPALLHAPVAGR